MNKVFRCVECGESVPELYTDFGNNAVRLCCCEHCGSVVDPYIEVDSLYIFLDLFLHKEQAYRHVLFNEKALKVLSSRAALLRIFVTFIMFDTYSQSALIEENENSMMDRSSVFLKFIVSFISSATSNLTFFVILTTLAQAIFKKEGRLVFYALIISTFGKLFNLLLLTWATDLRFRYGIQLLVYSSNLVALKVTSDFPSYKSPFFLLFIAIICRCVTVCMIWICCFERFPTITELFV